MPLYEYRCRLSRETFSRIAPMSESASPRICACGTPGDRVISPTRINRDYDDYECPVSGKLVSGRRAHEENLRRTGSRVLESGERENQIAARARSDADFERSVDNTVERVIAEMPSAQVEQLATEVTRGADLAIERITA